MVNKISSTISDDEYSQGIIDLFSNIMVCGTFDGLFLFIKELMRIFLDSNDWKQFLQSGLINKNVLNKILSKLNDKTNVESLNCDKLWCKLLNRMCDSFDNSQLLDEYDNINNDINNESKDDNNEINNDFVILNKMLKKQQFSQFEEKISNYDKNNKILKLV